MNLSNHKKLREVIVKATAKAGIDKIVDEIKALITRSWDEKTRDALIETKRKLELTDMVTSDQLDIVLRDLERKLGEPVAAAVKTKVFQLQEAAYLLGAREATRNMGVSFSFGLPDLKSLDVLESNMRFWIGNHFAGIKENVNEVLQGFFTGGYDRNRLIDEMTENLKELFDRSDTYWEMFADHTAAKAREIGRVAGYEAAGLRRVQFRARIDDRTSEVCRRMNGKIIQTSTMRGKVDRYLKACETENKTKIKNSWKWYSDKQLENMSEAQLDRKIQSGDISLPPLHARCRSITVAYFGD